MLDYFSADVFENYIHFKNIKECVIFPDIGNYVMQNTDEGGNYLKTAIDIKNDKKFKAFKRLIDEIEEQVNNGNISEYRRCLKNINEMTKEIVERKAKMDRNVSFSIFLIPFNLSVDIDVKRRRYRNIQLNFLKDMAEYYLL